MAKEPINIELEAKKYIKELYQQLKSLNYNLSSPAKGFYNYNFDVVHSSSKIKVLVYFGQHGIKRVVQGNQYSELFKNISKFLTDETPQEKTPKNEIEDPDIYIGVDESGKGDFFGPLVIAGFYVKPEIKSELLQLEIRDSKSLSDGRVKKISEILTEKYKEFFSVVKIYPEKYNELYSKIKNLNTLLAWGHSRCIENILSKHKAKVAICDQFGNENFIKRALMKEGKQIELIQTHKAERFIGVAAASILARNFFLEWFEKIEKELGLKIPRGTNQIVIETAKKISELYGKESLKKFVKIHFKTMNEL